MRGFILIISLFFQFLNLYAIEPVEAIFTRGLHYYIQREFKKAALEWKKLLEIDPTHQRARIYMEKAFNKYNTMEVNFYKGLDKFNKALYREAIPFFKRTLMINPRHKKALFYLRLCYLFLQKKEEQKKSSKELVKEADTYADEDEFTKAIALYKIALMLDPENKEAKIKLSEVMAREQKHTQNLELKFHLQAAREYHNKQQYMFAVQEWSKALMIDPENEEAKEGLEVDKALLEEQIRQQKINSLIAEGIELYMNGEYLQAKYKFEEVLKLDKENETAIKYLEKIKQKLKEIEKLKLIQDESERHFKLGVIYFNNKKYKKALDEFEITLQLNPEHKKAKEYIDKIKEILKRLEEEERLKRLQLVQKLLEKGIIFYQSGEYKSAIDSFLQVLEIDPENRYAKEYLKLAREALLLEKYSRITEDSPYYIIVENLKKKGIEAFKNKEYKIALNFFKQIKELFPLNKEANVLILKVMYIINPEKAKEIVDEFYKKGLEFYKKRKYGQALKRFVIVKEVAPDYPKIDYYIKICKKPPSLYEKEISLHYKKGALYYSKGKYKKAIEEWKKVQSIDPSPLSNKYLARALSGIARAELKLYGVKKKRKLTSEKAKIVKKYYYLGLIYYTRGEYKKALKEWQKILKIDPTNLKALKSISRCKRKLALYK